MTPLKVCATFFKDYNGNDIVNIKIPQGTKIYGYLSQPLDTLVFQSNNVQYCIPQINTYADIQIE